MSFLDWEEDEEDLQFDDPPYPDDHFEGFRQFLWNETLLDIKYLPEISSIDFPELLE